MMVPFYLFLLQLALTTTFVFLSLWDPSEDADSCCASSVFTSWSSFCSVRCSRVHLALWAWRENCEWTQTHTHTHNWHTEQRSTEWGQTGPLWGRAKGCLSWQTKWSNSTVTVNGNKCWISQSGASLTQWRQRTVHDPAAVNVGKMLVQHCCWERTRPGWEKRGMPKYTVTKRPHWTSRSAILHFWY